MNKIKKEQIDAAVTALHAGGVIIFPTETSYGLGCDATNDDAIRRIYAIKGRDSEKALPVLIPDGKEASAYIQVTPVIQDLIDAHWPGALNIITETQPTSPISPLCARDGRQSVRVSSNPVASAIVRRFGKPIVATSANISGEEPMYSVRDAEEIFKEAPDRPDVIVEAGDLPRIPASTTVRVIDDVIEVLRQGRVEVDV